MKIIAINLPVMKKCCKTCPFRQLDNGRQLNPELASKVTMRTLFKSNQICHGTEKGPKRMPQNRCKGSYDFNRTIYKRMGLDLDLMD